MENHCSLHHGIWDFLKSRIIYRRKCAKSQIHLRKASENHRKTKQNQRESSAFHRLSTKCPMTFCSLPRSLPAGSPYTHENTAPLVRKRRAEEKYHDYFSLSAKICRSVEVTFMKRYFNISAEPAHDCLPARKQHLRKQRIRHESSADDASFRKRKY